MSQPIVVVESIAFRHAVLPLRLDDGRVMAGTPQWVTGERTHPVAVVLSRLHGPLRLDVVLRSTDPRVTEATIQALPVRGAGGDSALLWQAAERTAVFGPAGRAEIACEVEVLAAGVESSVLEWQWQYRLRDEPWTETTVTRHDVAITLDDPGEPWTAAAESPGRTTTPWWDVLTLAAAAARGATSPDGVATRVAEAFFHRQVGGRYVWDDSAGEAYTSSIGALEPYFDCSAWLRLLRSEPQPSVIDCSDAATVVMAFANVLGCRLELFALHVTDPTPPIRMVGHARWQSRDFASHQFTVDSTDRLRVWDGCLQVSTDSLAIPRAEPLTFRVAAMVDEEEYYFRLQRDRAPLERRRIRDVSVRPVRPAPADVPRVLLLTPLQRRAADHYGFEMWAEPRSIGGGRGLSGQFRVPGWETLPSVGAPPDSGPPSADRDRVWRFLLRAEDAHGVLVALDAYDCTDAAPARLRLVAVLSGMDAITLSPVSTGAGRAGDVEFAAPEGSDAAVVAGIRGAVCVVARRATPEATQKQVREIYDAYLDQLR